MLATSRQRCLDLYTHFGESLIFRVSQKRSLFCFLNSYVLKSLIGRRCKYSICIWNRLQMQTDFRQIEPVALFVSWAILWIDRSILTNGWRIWIDRGLELLFCKNSLQYGSAHNVWALFQKVYSVFNEHLKMLATSRQQCLDLYTHFGESLIFRVSQKRSLFCFYIYIPRINMVRLKRL